jgi:hypothetical protein
MVWIQRNGHQGIDVASSLWSSLISLEYLSRILRGARIYATSGIMGYVLRFQDEATDEDSLLQVF